jgi:mono/diheme cytochrome c family protein
MHCHGLSGDGNGPTAKFLLPLPRDYRPGIFKFTSTDAQANPTREDLMQTLKNGIPATSMPSFALFDQKEIENVLDYVILLSIRGQTERFVVADAQSGGELTAESVADNAGAIVNRWVGTESKVVKPKVARTPLTPESIENGRKLFLSERAQCVKCHGKEGRGDGFLNDPNVDPKNTVDSWGKQSRPANLTLGVFRGGGRPIDLFRRLHSGVKGTPMASQSSNLKDEEIWDLVNFVLYLPYHETALSTEPAKKEHGAGGT